MFGLWGLVIAGGVWWWWWCGCGGVEWVVEDHRVQHGGAMVAAWCMCCVYKANVFRKQNHRRFDEGQSTKVGRKTNMLNQCIIVGYLGRTTLDDDRSGGRVDGMEWFGEGYGWGWGWRGEGEVSGNRSILDCSNMMTVLCVSCAKRGCFV